MREASLFAVLVWVLSARTCLAQLTDDSKNGQMRAYCLLDACEKPQLTLNYRCNTLVSRGEFRSLNPAISGIAVDRCLTTIEPAMVTTRNPPATGTGEESNLVIGTLLFASRSICWWAIASLSARCREVGPCGCVRRATVEVVIRVRGKPTHGSQNMTFLTQNLFGELSA